MAKRRRQNVEQGYMVRVGKRWVFHPIRASSDYDPEDVGEYSRKRKRKPAKKRKGSARKRKTSRRKNPSGVPSGWISAKAVKVTRLPGGGVNVKVRQ